MASSLLSPPGLRPLVLCAALLLAGAAAVNAQEPESEASTPGVATGLVVDEAGKPLAGAVLALVDPGDLLDVHALLAAPPRTTDADGRIAVPVGEAELGRHLLVVARGRQACAVRIDAELVRLGWPVPDLVLVPAAQLVGRVRGPDGKALAGAHVAVESVVRDMRAGVPTGRSGAFANERGIFVVPCVPDTGLEVSIRCQGYVGKKLLASQGSPLDVTLEPAEQVAGRVVDERGEPVAGAAVSLAHVGASPPRLPVESDAEGRFVVDAPPGVRFRVRANLRDGEPRWFASDLLHGARDGVLVTPTSTKATASGGTREVSLLVRDAKTGATLERVHVSSLNIGPSPPDVALFHRHDPGVDYPGEGKVQVLNSAKGLLVEAPGHGFELVELPGGDDPLVVDLGPEAVLTGVVTDAATGKSLAGVHVRALPKGNSSGSGGALEGLYPVTDANGRFRIAGLRPGEYGVQAHAADRVASRPEFVTLTADGEQVLDLKVPAPRWVEVRASGAMAPGPAPRLQGSSQVDGGGNGYFAHRLTVPPPVPVRGPGLHRVGPVGSDAAALTLSLPSRVRVGVEVAIPVERGENGFEVDLAEARGSIVRGRVEASGLPMERVGVVALFVTEEPGPSSARTVRAGVDGAGEFVLDLAPGAYRVQLIDFASGLAFHTEPDEFVVGGKDLVLRPQFSWLDVQLEPQQEGGHVEVPAVSVRVDGAAQAAVAGLFLSRSGYVPIEAGVRRVRLLVPRGDLRVQVRRAFGALSRVVGGFSYETAADEAVTVDRSEHVVTLRVSSSPSDEELEKDG